MQGKTENNRLKEEMGNETGANAGRNMKSATKPGLAERLLQN